MANASTLYRFHVELSDIDRGVYDTLDLRVARHPSEDEERLVVRTLAHVLAAEDGLEFGRGLSSTEDAALWTRSLMGEVKTWIDVGLPSADRLHRASKLAGRVLVVTHKPPDVLRKEWGSRKIHRSHEVEVIQLDPPLVRTLATNLQRNVQWYVTIQSDVLTLVEGERVIEGPFSRCNLAHFLGEGS